MAKIKELAPKPASDDEESSEYEEEEEEDSGDDESEESGDEPGVDVPLDFQKTIDEGSDDEDAEAASAEEDNDDEDEGSVDVDDEVMDSNANNRVAPVVKHDIAPLSSSKKVAEVDEYENDSSDEEDLRNTIGNVPIDWYDEYAHIGYDWNASKIIKPKRDDEVDDFVKKIDDPNYWRTIKDRMTGENVVLTDADADLIKRLKAGHYPDPNFNPYADFIDFFTYEKMIHPVTNRPETKASFIPSLAEKRKVSQLVSRIKREWQNPKVEIKKKDTQFRFDYDLWEKDGDVNSKRLQRYIPAPKTALPGHEESYNPPPEYLLTPDEEAKWREKEPEERKLNFLPKKFPSLRLVPAFPQFVKERFERCLDLYLCPRARKMRANVNPEDLIPKLPKPKDLQPFPCIESLVYYGHEGVVRSIAVEPKGQFVASAADDGTLRVWEILTTRCVKTIEFGEPIKYIAWCPDENKCLILVALGKIVHVVNPGVGDKLVVTNTDMLFKESLEGGSGDSVPSKDSNADWQVIDSSGTDTLWIKGIRITVVHKFDIKNVTWHSRGDYFAAVMPSGSNKSVMIHQLSKRRSQMPFSKSKGLIQCVLFHPTRPYFFVATQRYVRIYNLMKQSLSKKLMTNVNYVSSLAIHPGGDNVIVGSFDSRLSWFDLDLSNKPYKSLRYHKKSIREVAYHPKYPLFASASDDGTVIVSHGMVYSDLLQNPLIVPVKVLRGHKVVDDLGVLDCCFHPQQPWIFSAGADGTVRLFT